MKNCNQPFVLALGLMTVTALAWACFSPASAGDKKADKPAKKATDKKAEKPAKKDAALERTRKTVRMLDDIYKTAVVLITEHYVNDTDDLPAGSAAIALFDAIKKKGWHEVRLLDATGEPYDEKNVAKDEFEKTATKKMKAGEAWYDEVQKKDGKRYLRAATPIPVVLKKCAMCHPHYENAKKGEAIGLLSYTIEIE